MHWDPGQGAVTPGENEPDLPASVGGSPAEVGEWLWLTVGTRTLAAEVLGSTPWPEASQSLSLAPPRAQVGSSVGLPQAKNQQGGNPAPSINSQVD